MGVGRPHAQIVPTPAGTVSAVPMAKKSSLLGLTRSAAMMLPLSNTDLGRVARADPNSMRVSVAQERLQEVCAHACCEAAASEKMGAL